MERRKFLKTSAIATAGAAAAGLASTTIGSVLGQTTTPTSTQTSTATQESTPAVPLNGEMEVFDCIRNRRSICWDSFTGGFEYTQTLVPDVVITKILDATRWACSELNCQPVQFIVVKDPVTRHDIQQSVCDEMYDPRTYSYIETWPQTVRAGRFFVTPDGRKRLINYESYNGPVFVVPWADREKREIYPYSMDPYRGMHSDAYWAAAGTLALVARAFGVGTVYLTFANPFTVKKMLGIPETGDIGPTMPLGYPTGWPPANDPALYTDRRPLENMVHYETFDNDKWQKYRPTITYGGYPRRETALKKLL